MVQCVYLLYAVCFTFPPDFYNETTRDRFNYGTRRNASTIVSLGYSDTMQTKDEIYLNNTLLG